MTAAPIPFRIQILLTGSRCLVYLLMIQSSPKPASPTMAITRPARSRPRTSTSLGFAVKYMVIPHRINNRLVKLNMLGLIFITDSFNPVLSPGRP